MISILKNIHGTNFSCALYRQNEEISKEDFSLFPSVLAIGSVECETYMV